MMNDPQYKTERVERPGYVHQGEAGTTHELVLSCAEKMVKKKEQNEIARKRFGYKTTGGKNGKIYVVTDSSGDELLNPKHGTLRHAVIQNEPLWIIFARNMIITLQQELIMQGDMTIDRRGARVDIAYGAGITIKFVRNVIIHDVRIQHIVPKEGGMIRDSIDHYGFRTKSEGEGISLFGSQNVWIDHVSITNGTDGLINAIEGLNRHHNHQRTLHRS
ncbi:hypothetical protein SASPL_115033 [Salvia splendens]|uniref:Pectate lyase n=1 Tax=Salvia splendens TaxID=180675 RepID=A0A8X8Y314_SALSN|nr:hypothetical protein SASPL_115033 [Salvia splendens]